MKAYFFLLIAFAPFAFSGKGGNGEGDITTDGNASDEECCKASNIKSCYNAMNIKVKKIEQEKDLNIQGIKLSFNSTVEPNGYVYKNEEGDEAVFTLLRREPGADAKLFGTLKTRDGKSFALEKCKRRSVWIEYDVATFDVEEDPDSDVFGNTSAPLGNAIKKRQVEDSTTIVTFSVIVYYTQEFAEVTPDPEGFATQVIAETNQGYINSKMPVRVELFCVKGISMSDYGKSGSAILNEFRAYFNWNRQALLKTADSAVLLTERSAGAGQVVALCTACSNLPQTGYNIAYAKKANALGGLTFGHELGHMFGAGHDADTGHYNSYYSYGYGWHYPGYNYRSILAYPPGVRINMYSMDALLSGTVQLGSSTADNRKVIMDNRFIMAATGDESGTCTDQGTGGDLCTLVTGKYICGGNDIGYGVITASDLECAAYCKATAGCAGWTRHQPTGTCYRTTTDACMGTSSYWNSGIDC